MATRVITLKRVVILLPFLFAVFSAPCLGSNQIQFVGDFLIPSAVSGQGIPVGGLSGLTYDRLEDVFYAVSDDRGEEGPYRIYRLKLNLWKKKQIGLQSIEAILLTDENGHPLLKNDYDFEGIALANEEIILSSEGNQRPGNHRGPAILSFSKEGKATGEFVLPKTYWDEADVSVGVKNNKSLESMTFDSFGRKIYSANEEPLRQDSGSRMVRIQEFENTTRGPLRQFAYQLGKEKGTGLAELVALGNHQFLSLERHFSNKSDKTKVKIFHTDCRHASSVGQLTSLNRRQFVPCFKKNLINLNSIAGKLSKIYPKIDNIEGLAFGPNHPGGGKWLIAISDNNFKDKQRTQILVFHWLEK